MTANNNNNNNNNMTQQKNEYIKNNNENIKENNNNNNNSNYFAIPESMSNLLSVSMPEYSLGGFGTAGFLRDELYLLNEKGGMTLSGYDLMFNLGLNYARNNDSNNNNKYNLLKRKPIRMLKFLQSLQFFEDQKGGPTLIQCYFEGCLRYITEQIELLEKKQKNTNRWLDDNDFDRYIGYLTECEVCLYLLCYVM